MTAKQNDTKNVVDKTSINLQTSLKNSLSDHVFSVRDKNLTGRASSALWWFAIFAILRRADSHNSLMYCCLNAVVLLNI